MEMRVLQYFLTVAQEESVTRAAEVLHITQPTLNRQLAQLEREQPLGRAGSRFIQFVSCFLNAETSSGTKE